MFFNIPETAAFTGYLRFIFAFIYLLFSGHSIKQECHLFKWHSCLKYGCAINYCMVITKLTVSFTQLEVAVKCRTMKPPVITESLVDIDPEPLISW